MFPRKKKRGESSPEHKGGRNEKRAGDGAEGGTRNRDINTRQRSRTRPALKASIDRPTAVWRPRCVGGLTRLRGESLGRCPAILAGLHLGTGAQASRIPRDKNLTRPTTMQQGQPADNDNADVDVGTRGNKARCGQAPAPSGTGEGLCLHKEQPPPPPETASHHTLTTAKVPSRLRGRHDELKAQAPRDAHQLRREGDGSVHGERQGHRRLDQARRQLLKAPSGAEPRNAPVCRQQGWCENDMDGQTKRRLRGDGDMFYLVPMP